MVDTVFVKVEEAGERVPLEAEKSTRYASTQYGTTSGKWGDLVVSYPDDGTMSISGSLSNFLFGSNARTLCASELAEAVRLISEGLGFDPALAHVYRIDLAATLNVSEIPQAYLPIFESMPYMKLGEHDASTRTFWNNTRELQLYDKGKEAGLDGNLLRIELRQFKRVKEAFEKAVTFADLADPTFSATLVQKYRSAYASVRRHYRERDLMSFRTPTEFSRALAAIGVTALGGLSQVERLIDQQGITCPTGYSRVRQRAREYAESGTQDSRDRIRAGEVDEAVEQACDYVLGVDRVGGYPLVYGADWG